MGESFTLHPLLFQRLLSINKLVYLLIHRHNILYR